MGVLDRDTAAPEARDAGLETVAVAAVMELGTLGLSSVVSSGSSAITVWASSDPTKGATESNWTDGVLDVTMVAGRERGSLMFGGKMRVCGKVGGNCALNLAKEGWQKLLQRE